MTSAPDKGGDPSLDFTTPATIPTVRRHQMDVPLLLLRAALLQNWLEEGWEVYWRCSRSIDIIDSGILASGMCFLRAPPNAILCQVFTI